MVYKRLLTVALHQFLLEESELHVIVLQQLPDILRSSGNIQPQEPLRGVELPDAFQ